MFFFLKRILKVDGVGSSGGNNKSFGITSFISLFCDSFNALGSLQNPNSFDVS